MNEMPGRADNFRLSLTISENNISYHFNKFALWIRFCSF